jgi:PKHD-type hydroxylase
MKPIDNIFFWQYPKGTLPDALIEHTLERTKTRKREAAQIGSGAVDKSIRSVERTPLDEFDPISIQMFGLAVKANDVQFRYKLGGPCQFEMLHYDKEGDHYDSHIDTVLYDNGYCRKLTVMAYLNDQYEGGRFYFVTHSDARQYVDVGKGSVLVFPPYVLHGVEPVTQGARESVVGWITGPNLK